MPAALSSPAVPKPRAGDVIRVACTEIGHRGVGVGRLSGLVVFIFGAMPGEEVSARVTKVHRRHVFADTVEVHRASPERVVPPCPYFGTCGGCQLQHVSYGFQLQSKREVLERALRREGVDLPAEVEVVGSSEEWRYRWRGEFHRMGQGPDLGFKARSNYQVVGISDCLIHHPSITANLAAIGEAVQRAGPQVRTVQMTAGDGGRQLLVDTRPDRSASARVAADASTSAGEEVVITDEATSISYRGRGFRVFPDSFIQVNQATLERLYEPVVDLIRPEIAGGHVVDAYGGIGILSLRLADAGARVTVIESNPIAARLCQLHAEMYAPGRVQVVCGPVEREISVTAPAAAVVVDPPRAGLAPEVRGWLSLAGPPAVAYLSCEVSALARDLKTLCRLGPYRLTQLRLVDMFPQTYHFEAVALLRRS
ncbi:MAG: TRAM domain-containing protein [Candidatus Dormiibacterota bacterium]